MIKFCKIVREMTKLLVFRRDQFEVKPQWRQLQIYFIMKGNSKQEITCIDIDIDNVGIDRVYLGRTILSNAADKSTTSPSSFWIILTRCRLEKTSRFVTSSKSSDAFERLKLFWFDSLDEFEMSERAENCRTICSTEIRLSSESIFRRLVLDGFIASRCSPGDVTDYINVTDYVNVTDDCNVT